jgi:hypothetical protein
MPSGQSAARTKRAFQKKSLRSIVAGGREKQRYDALTVQPSRCKDVIELFLLSAQFFLFIQIPLLRPQLSEHLAAAVRGFVNLHLSVSLQLQSLKVLEKCLFRFDDRVDFDLHGLQAICRSEIQQGFLSVLTRFCHFVC